MQESIDTTFFRPERMLTFGEFLRLLVQALVQQGVSPLVLRNYEGFPDSNVGNDVDFMIHPAELPLALRAVQSIEGVRIVGYNEQFHIAMLFLEGVASAPGIRSFQIDFIRSFTWKGMPYLSPDAVLKSAVKRRQGNFSFLVPSAVHEAVISLLTSLLVSGFVKEKYLPKAQQTFLDKREEVIAVLKPSFGMKQAANLVDAAIEGDRQRLLACIQPLRIELTLRNLRRCPVRSLLAIARHHWIVIGVRLSPKTLETVCVLCPDDAVRSAAVEALLPLLRFCAPEVQGRGPWPRYRLKNKSSSMKQSGEPEAEIDLDSPATKTKALNWLFEEWLSRFRGRKNLTLRIQQNSCCDLLAQPQKFGYRGPTWSARLINKISPQHDLRILLDTTFANPQQEIGGNPRVEVPEPMSVFRVFVKAGKSYAILDGTQPIRRVVEDSYAAIIDALSQRAARRIRNRL